MMLWGLAALTAAAAQLTVGFSAPPEVHFNRRGESTLTVWVGKTTRTVALRGLPDPADPDNVYLRLHPVTLAFPAKFSGPVKLSTRLFLCDIKSGVCTVEEHQQRVNLRVGQQLDLLWRVGEARR